MIDQETSLFHDIAPMLSVTEFGEPMPSSDALWRAKSAEEWASIFEEAHEQPKNYESIGTGSRSMSLRSLFRLFLDDGIIAKRIELTPIHLRLLLHPLQSLVYQSLQMLSCFPDKTAIRRGSKSITAASTKGQLKEASALLQRWYGLADRYIKTKPMCAMMQSTFVIFHLISLNAVTNFAEIEQLARRDEGELSSQRMPILHKRCITDAEEATVHCGQILRLVQTMPPSVRPLWWAGAVYRAALVLWTISLNNGNAPKYDSSFSIDMLTPQHPTILRYLAEKEGTPLLTKLDGTLLAIDDPLALLLHCTQIIEVGLPTKFTEGLRLKLTRLAKEGSR